jgi:hypothetical protein
MPDDLGKRTFPLVKVVARGGVEPPTFRFSVQSPPDRSSTTWHFAGRSCVVEALEAAGRLELLDSPLDSARRYVGRAQPHCRYVAAAESDLKRR